MLNIGMEIREIDVIDILCYVPIIVYFYIKSFTFHISLVFGDVCGYNLLRKTNVIFIIPNFVLRICQVIEVIIPFQNNLKLITFVLFAHCFHNAKFPFLTTFRF